MPKTKQNKASTKRGTKSMDSRRSRSKTPTNRSTQDEEPKYPSIQKILQMPVKASKINVSGTPVLRQITINPSKVKQYDENDIVQNLVTKISELMEQNAVPKLIQKMQEAFKTDISDNSVEKSNASGTNPENENISDTHQKPDYDDRSPTPHVVGIQMLSHILI